MKTKIITIIICSLTMFFACEKDGEFTRVTGLQSEQLMASETNVVITEESSSANVLAMTWDESELRLSEPSWKLPNSVPVVILEVSATSNFDSIVQIVSPANPYVFSGVALNTLGKNLGFKAGEETPMYFRIKSSLGTNTQAYYSEPVTVNVTCFSIDMSIGFVLDASKNDTGYKLYSPQSDGEYAGFTGVTAWYNWSC